MECIKFHKLISSYIDEEASSLERQAVERHVAACPACRAELTNELRLKDMVKLSYEKTAEIDLSKNIMAMIAPKAAVPVKKKGSFYKKFSVFAAAVAALFVLAFAAIMTMGTEETQVAGNEKLEEYVIEHVGAGVADFNGTLATVNYKK